ncbi:hypothetical protein IGI95_002676 [Enterococcus sp. DIV0784]|uniref:helix-turn-helix domain-containing protein n=1 Tax=unclassified Enterococcus TaxID=2608891 RepID=UPI003F1E4B1C
MIEKYIEKDVMRQIKVMEYLFELKKIKIQDIADILEVSKITIKRDIENILVLNSKINVIFESSSIIEVSFWKGATRYELISTIYQQSHFLRVCAFYFMGKTNYIKIVEQEHISVAKAFNLKRKVEDFLKENDIMSENGQFIDDEFKYRLIYLTIWMRIDLFDSQIDQRTYQEANRIVKMFVKKFSNNLNYREYHFFQLVIYLSLKRKDKNLIVSDTDMSYVHSGILFNEVKTLLKQYEMNEHEIAYIAMMYRLLNQNLINYQYLLMSYNQLRKDRIDKIPALGELIHRFEHHFKRELFKEIMFEKPFLRFVVSIFLNRQMFLVEKHYFLGKQQRKLVNEVRPIVLDWADSYNLPINISDITLEKFCLQVSPLLLTNSLKKWNIFIVAEDEFGHITYREWITKKLNMDYISIDNILYYSLDSLPVYIDIDSSIVICERSLMNISDEIVRQVKTFPISLFSITEDLQEFFEYILKS